MAVCDAPRTIASNLVPPSGEPSRNFKDFVASSDVQVIRDGEVARYMYPDHSLLIVQPRAVMDWVNGDQY